MSDNKVDYNEDAKDIYTQLGSLKEQQLKMEKTIGTNLRDIKKDFDELEKEHLDALKLIHNLSMEFKIESGKMSVKVGMATFVITSILTIVLENVLTDFNIFK